MIAYKDGTPCVVYELWEVEKKVKKFNQKDAVKYLKSL